MSEARRDCAIVAAVAVLCFLNSLEGTFHYDDGHSIIRNPGVRSLANVPAFFSDPALFSADVNKRMYRPVLLVTYAVNYAIGGYAPWAYILGNLLLHAGCAILVWVLGRHLLANPRGAIIAGLLFAVHPLAAEPVNYVSSRSESLAAFFYLAAFLWYVRKSGVGTSYASILFFALGLLSKSTVITLPAVLILYDCFSRRREGGAVASSLLRRHGPYWLVAGGYLAIIRANGFLGSSLEAPVRDWTTQFQTQVKAAVYYIKLLAVPASLNVEHQFSESATLTASVAGGCLLLVSLACVIWRIRDRLPAFPAAWGMAVILPASVMPLNMLVNERRLYLVLAGFAWFVGDLVGRRSRAGLLVVGVGLLSVLSFSRNRVWQSDLGLWQDAAAKAPGMYRAQANLGKALQLAGMEEEAVATYERAIALDPRHGDAYNNMAVLHHQAGRLDEAVAWYHQAIELYPEQGVFYCNLADAHALRGEFGTAVDLYQKAIAIDDRNGATWANYGQVLLQAKRPDEAEQALLRAVEIMPRRPEAYNNLGNLYGDRGDFAGAIAMYEKALDRHPDEEASVLENLADTYLDMERPADARRIFAQILTIDSENASAYFGIGTIHRGAGDLAAAVADLERAIDCRPDFNRARVELAEVLSELGRHGDAAAQFGQALARDPEYSRAWYGLAASYERLDRLGEAVEAYSSFLRVWPHRDGRYREARQRLAQLQNR